MSTVHVLPVGDLIEHDDGYCGWLITHHSLDGITATACVTPWTSRRSDLFDQCACTGRDHAASMRPVTGLGEIWEH